MRNDEKRLLSKIYCLEDILLRSKNSHEIEKLRGELTVLRKKLQKIQWENQKRSLY